MKSEWITSLIYGLCGIFAALLVCLLPETNNLPLCETIDDVLARERGELLVKNEDYKRYSHRERTLNKNGTLHKSIDDNICNCEDSEFPNDEENTLGLKIPKSELCSIKKESASPKFREISGNPFYDEEDNTKL